MLGWSHGTWRGPVTEHPSGSSAGAGVGVGGMGRDRSDGPGGPQRDAGRGQTKTWTLLFPMWV